MDKEKLNALLNEKPLAEKAREVYYNDERGSWITPWDETSPTERDAWNRVVSIVKKES